MDETKTQMTPPSPQSSSRQIERERQMETKLQPFSDATASTQLTPEWPPKLFILDNFHLINRFAL